MITLTRLDDGRTVEARVGDRLRIELAENPTTGFAWAIAAGGRPVLRSLPSSFEPPEPILPGGGGMRAFAFEIARPGTAAIDLRLVRGGDAASPAAASFAVTVAAGC